MSVFTLELDTTAPVVTFGPPSDTDAGETLTVPFAINEPDCLSAQLELPDGRVVDGSVGVGVVTVDLPVDTPDGLATLILRVRDEVLNETDCTLAIPVTGVATRPPRTYPSPGVPIPALPPLETTHLRVRSSQRLRTRSTVRSAHTARTRLGVRSGAALAVDHTATSHVRAGSHLDVARRGEAVSTPITMVTTHALARRREGPRTEDEIATILGLL